MPLEDISIDGRDMSLRERKLCWQALVGEHLADVELDASPDIPAGEAFAGTLRIRSFERGTLADIASGGQVLTRTADRIRRAKSDAVLFNIILSGHCRLEQDGRQAVPTAGSLFLYESARPYHIETSPDFRTIVVMIDRGRLERSLGNLRFYTGRAMCSVDTVARIAGSFWQTLSSQLDGVPDAAANTLIEAGIDVVIPALRSMAGDRAEGSEACELTVMRATAFIASAFHRESLTVDDIAAAAGVSTRRLQECFKEKGLTPMEQLRKHRLKHAHDRLNDGHCQNLSVLSIMSQSGFSDPAHFSRAFRKEYGISPSAARSASQRRPAVRVA
ncbi:helix-turn-helix domain-containing protein [Methylobacterium nodulans]|uniref:Transcriptional regulator, AraC family n=1 Tax=Methylobacterium nodulans (strain LMG 21967 / CNCM I-2342 / ORS 2060) TaxID=460265 RepID=B8IWN2_METNO|nr:helix-turn-helix domain-containing protein [Methylobacterium nodulans]ACL62923.1 transcriptional regulator, AraC family [Methylobacterium nodulans ORS 2060]